MIPLDARIIASNDVDLEARVADGTFRPDLYFRLTSFVIQLPALRARPEDIPFFIDRFLERLSLQLGSTLTMMPAAKRLLCNYPWPGNVTELESIIDRATLRSEGKPVRPEHLPEILQNPCTKAPRSDDRTGHQLGASRKNGNHRRRPRRTRQQQPDEQAARYWAHYPLAQNENPRANP